jgi:hypothetical protein
MRRNDKKLDARIGARKTEFLYTVWAVVICNLAPQLRRFSFRNGKSWLTVAITNKLFEDGTLEATKEDIFEQIICFTLSEQFNISKSLADYFAEEAKFIENIK